MPSDKGCAAGKLPRPSSVLATGMPCDSAKAMHLGLGAAAVVGLGDAVAGEDDRLLRGANERDGVLEAGRGGAEHGVRAEGRGRGGVEVEGGGGLLRVLGDVDQHRAGAAGERDLEGLAHGGRDVFGAGHQEVVLGDRQRDAGDVDLLKRVAAEDLGRHLAGDADDRDGVQHGGGDAGDEVRRAGAAGGHADADPARGARVAVGHVRGALLVAHENVVDGELAQRVVDGQDGAAGIAEDGGDALAGEGGPEDLGAGELGWVRVRRIRLRHGEYLRG